VHLADGIVSQTPLVLCLELGGAAGVAGALFRLRGSRVMPAWTGTLAAFVLVAQALNFPIVPGASAHVVGTALLTLTLGPARAIVALCAVLLVQALMFADGGVLVIGVNALTMALIPAIVVHSLRRLAGDTPRGLAIAAVLGTALGNLAGALVLSAALVSGARAPFAMTAGWIVSIQTLAGVVEGVLTAGAVGELARRAPALVHELGTPPRSENRRQLGAAMLLVSVGALALFAALPHKSALPDALELVLARLGLGQ
jgi:cobalt/nickel transport system permease protein